MQYAKVERKIAGRIFSFETGRIAKQAAGAVLASCGETMTLNTVCTAKPRPDIDFFPLSVDYREKLYAAGKFPGGFMKREGRPSNKEILTCRLIDRPVRPMWPDGYQEEVQIMSSVVSADRENDPDVIAMNGCFAALHVSSLPFQGPLAAVRVGRVNGKFVAFPTIEQLDEGDLDLIVAASSDAIAMVEGASFEISEEDFLDALDYARGICEELLDMQNELRRQAKPRKSTWEAPKKSAHPVAAKVNREFGPKVRKTLMVEGKHEREEALDALKKKALEKYAPEDAPDYADLKKAVSGAFSALKGEMVRDLILKDDLRIDGRGLEDVRAITIDPSLLPRAHGSVLFTRGETQAIVTATLGTPRDQQQVDTLMEEYSKRFDLHYNFPPYSVGEVRPVRGIGRREIGHGTLAERALSSVVPPEKDFPYTIRIVSDITESNGSSSMASVCGGTLAMMDAGVPIRQPVAGIAMGLVAEGGDAASGNFRILSDILGTEDHVGDMDFKVAGTGRGITAVQMDIKIRGLTTEIMREALQQARRGRLHILKEMIKAMRMPREDISEFAPRLMQVRISPEKIGLVIGPGGKTIKRIQEETGAHVEIDDEGVVSISSTDSQAAKDAKSFIEHLTAEVEVGRVYEGRVVSIKDFGCFVEVLPGQEGLCHVSELDMERVDEVTDVVSLGDTIPVKVLLRDEQGRLKLSRRAALEDAGGNGGGRPPREAEAEEGAEGGDDRPPRRDRDDRPPRRDRDDRPPRRDDDRRGPPRGRGGDDRPPRRDGPRGGGRDRDGGRPPRREGGRSRRD